MAKSFINLIIYTFDDKIYNRISKSISLVVDRITNKIYVHAFRIKFCLEWLIDIDPWERAKYIVILY